MKIAAAFKTRELFFAILAYLVAAAVVSFTSSFLFQTASLFWIPFLLVLLLVMGRFAQNPLPVFSAQSNHFFLVFKIIGIFLLMVACYFGLGQGLLMYQLVTYDAANQAILTQFANGAQLLWAVKLGLITWMIASGLALAMGVMDKHKISDFFAPLLKRRPEYALIIDAATAFSFHIFLLLFIVIVSFELSRSIISYLGFERPIFPELTILILAMILPLGYYFLHLKQRSERLAEKSASIGRIWGMQALWLTFLFLLAQGFTIFFILFFPAQAILPLAQPVFNLFNQISYEQTWLCITLAAAIVSAPLLARVLLRSLNGLRVWQAFFLLLVVPFGMALLGVHHLGFQFIPLAYPVPIVLENVTYHTHLGQAILGGSLLLLLLSFAKSETLQLALVDLMPTYLGQRIRRLREIVAKQNLALIVLSLLYLFVANYGYYFVTNILFGLVSINLLWVSAYLLYNLTYISIIFKKR